jgi:uncharacterized protein YcbK (DUF882 family)
MKDESEPGSEVSMTMSRRYFLKLGLLTVAASAASPIVASARTHLYPERSLAFYNIHTGEHLQVAYWTEGNYHAGALDEINYLLRDYRTGQVKAIDPSLLDLLNSVNHVLKSPQPFHVVSGYRSPETNAMLAEASNGVAKHSLHIEGKAIDIYLPDRSLPDLRRVALALGQGGVGYYPKSEFVHMDVGRVRSW